MASSPKKPDGIRLRELFKGAAGLGLAAALPGCSSLGRPAASSNRIRRENALPGTSAWMLAKTKIDPIARYRCPWIEGYCSLRSVRAGQSITFHVSTNPPSPFQLDIYRMGYYGGAGGRHMLSLGPFRGMTQPDPPIGRNRLRECQWDPCATLTIPSDWLSGVYVGKLTAEREGWQSYVIFIVRDDRKPDLIFQCSDNTWQAYNRWPSQFALYDDGKKEWYCGPGVDVSFNRPYGKYCQILDAPLSTGSGSWFLWEFPFAFWLESLGYDVTYISNLDTHTDPHGLTRARGFLSVGHDEYYSMEMFQHLMAGIEKGLNVAFFSGDTCWGRIGFRPGHDGQAHRVFSRIDGFGPRDENELKQYPEVARFPWQSPDEGRLLGARNLPPFTGGADWICTLPDHWLYAGTGMNHGDRIPGLVGWEWHGDPATEIAGLEVVASGETWNGRERGTYAATVYPGRRGNIVFNASTCWWADVLSVPPGYVRPSVYTSPSGPDPRGQQITRNVLERMCQSRRATG